MAKLLYEVHLTDIARDSSGLCTAQRYDEIDAGGTLQQSVQAPPRPRFSCTVYDVYEHTNLYTSLLVVLFCTDWCN